MRGNERESHLLRLGENMLLIEDEPDALDGALEKYRAHFAEAAAQEPNAATPESYILSEEEWRRARESISALRLEQLALEGTGESRFSLPTRPTTRYHGNVAAFMAELKGR